MIPPPKLKPDLNLRKCEVAEKKGAKNLRPGLNLNEVDPKSLS